MPTRNYATRHLVDSNGQPTNTVQYLKESVIGSGSFDTIEPNPPSGGQSVIVGDELRLQYNPEAKGQTNPLQFVPKDANGNYIQLFFHPYYRFQVDFWYWMSLAERQLFGINMFNMSLITDAQRTQIPAKSGHYYAGESAVNQQYEGFGIYNLTLSQYEKFQREQGIEGVGQSYGTMANASRLTFNIENSQPFLKPGDLNQPAYPGFSQGGYFGQGKFMPWAQAKTMTITCITDGVTRTWGQLADLGEGAWDYEVRTRYANLAAVMQQVAINKSITGTINSLGTEMWQGPPYSNNDGSLFIEGNIDVTRVACTDTNGNPTGSFGDGNGNVMLNGIWYKLPQGKSSYSLEKSDQAYYYHFIDESAYKNGWQQTSNYMQLWALRKVEHAMAQEKGNWQQNRRKMRLRRADEQAISQMRQDEGINEQCPSLPSGFNSDTKHFQPPYYCFTAVVVSRFLSGNDADGNGFFMFPFADYDPNVQNKPLTDSVWARWTNVHLHAVTAYVQGRMYCQPLERWFTGSLLIEDMEISVNATGSNWIAPSGQAAYADGADNTVPTAAGRYKQFSDGVEIAICFGQKQEYGQVRSDLFRFPNGILGGNAFKITYSGPHARIVRAFIPTGTNNQTIDLGNFSVAAWEQAGYAGRTENIPTA